MPRATKRISDRRVFLWVALFGLTIALIITIVVFVSHGRNKRSGAADEVSFTESFATDTYKDAAATDANWNTADQLLELPTIDGNMYEADRSTPGATQFATSTLDYALDTQDNPHVSGGIAASAHLGYAKWSEPDDDWVGSDGSVGMEDLSLVLGTEAQSVQSVGIALSSQGNPVICWEGIFPDTSRGLFCTQYDSDLAAWVNLLGVPGFSTVETVDPGVSFAFLDIKLDSQDRPNVAYGRNDLNDINFERWNGSAFVDIGISFDVSNSGTALTSGISLTKLDLEIDSNDNPHIVYEDTESGDTDIYYLIGDVAGDTWEDVEGNAYDIGCTTTTCAASNVTDNAGASRSPSLILDSMDRPHITWSDNTGLARQEIFYTQWSGTDWVKIDGTTPGFDQLSASAVFGGTAPGANNPTIALDGSNPIIVWTEKIAAFGRGIYGRRWNGSVWADFNRVTVGKTAIREQLSGNPAVQMPQVFVDSFGNAAVAWPQTNVSTGFFSRWLDPVVNAQAQSTVVDDVTQNILSVTFVPTFTAGGDSTTFFASNDGGTTFAEVEPNVEYVFATTGSDLIWRAQMVGDAGDVSFTPQLDELKLIYTIEPEPVPVPVPVPVDEDLLVERIGGEDPTEQSINVSKERFATTDSAQIGYVSRDDLLVDVFAAAPLISRTSGTVLLNDPAALEDSVLAELQRALPDGAPVVVVGGTAALSPAVQQAIVDAGFSVSRIGNTNRRGTAADLATDLVTKNGGTTSKCYLTEDEALVDSLGAGGITGNLADGSADCILLSQRGKSALDPASEAYLDQHPDLLSLELIGGPIALPSQLEASIVAAHPSLVVTRTQGDNRFATNIALLEAHSGLPTHVVIASGQKESIPGARSAVTPTLSTLFFDALLAGPFAAENNAALVLVKTAELPVEAAAYLESIKAGVDRVTIVGSLAEVNQAVQDAVVAALQ